MDDIQSVHGEELSNNGNNHPEALDASFMADDPQQGADCETPEEQMVVSQASPLNSNQLNAGNHPTLRPFPSQDVTGSSEEENGNSGGNRECSMLWGLAPSIFT